MIFRHRVSLCGSAYLATVPGIFFPVLTLFSQSGMGSHDTFIDTETRSVCKGEAETGGLAPLSGYPRLHSKTHF